VVLPAPHTPSTDTCTPRSGARGGSGACSVMMSPATLITPQQQMQPGGGVITAPYRPCAGLPQRSPRTAEPLANRTYGPPTRLPCPYRVARGVKTESVNPLDHCPRGEFLRRLRQVRRTHPVLRSRCAVCLGVSTFWGDTSSGARHDAYRRAPSAAICSGAGAIPAIKIYSGPTEVRGVG
jgi:hypothetical protein